jgi:tRNA threonylcarbamoyladenosine biosynthesis protein TsaB
LFDGETVLSETTWQAGREHSTRLLLEVESALERVGLRVEQLTALAVARGPGSFTGVRVALSVAKGMAAGLRISAYGVCSLDVLALAAEPSTLRVRTVIEAGRGRYATGLYARGAPIEAPRLATPDQLLELVTEPTLIIGELSNEVRTVLSANPHVRLGPRASGARRAGYLAELAWQMARHGEPGDPAALDAIYIT